MKKNNELWRQNELLFNKNEMSLIEKKAKNTEAFKETLKMAMDDQSEVDKTFSGFEFTLSKIEEMLADKTNIDRIKSYDMERENGNGGKARYKKLKLIDKINHNDKKVRKQKTEPKSTKLFREKAKLVSSEIDKYDSSGSHGEKIDNLLTSITRKQEENLSKFMTGDRKKSKLEFKNEVNKNYLQTDDNKTDKKVSLNDIQGYPEDENDILSKLLSDSEEFSDVLEEYLSVNDEIKEVKHEIEKQREKLKVERRTENVVVNQTENIEVSKRRLNKTIPYVLKETDEKVIRTEDSKDAKNSDLMNETKIIQMKKISDICVKERNDIHDIITMGKLIDPIEKDIAPRLTLCTTSHQHCRKFCLDKMESLYHCSNTCKHGCNFFSPVLVQNVMTNGKQMKREENLSIYGDLKLESVANVFHHDDQKGSTNHGKTNNEIQEPAIDCDSIYELNCRGEIRIDATVISDESKTWNVLTKNIVDWSSNADITSNTQLDNVELSLQTDKQINDDSCSPMKQNKHVYLEKTRNENYRSCELQSTKDVSVDRYDDNVKTISCNNDSGREDEKKSITSDEELNIKIGRLSDEKIKRMEEIKEINKNMERKSCSLLEVHVVSGAQGNKRYGDSFLSPVCIKFLTEENELINRQDTRNESVDGQNLPVVLSGDFKNCEEVVVKRSWSLLNWLWGRKTKRHIGEDAAPVNQ